VRHSAAPAVKPQLCCICEGSFFWNDRLFERGGLKQCCSDIMKCGCTFTDM
jgi:hypothetical protein